MWRMILQLFGGRGSGSGNKGGGGGTGVKGTGEKGKATMADLLGGGKTYRADDVNLTEGSTPAVGHTVQAIYDAVAHKYGDKVNPLGFKVVKGDPASGKYTIGVKTDDGHSMTVTVKPTDSGTQWAYRDGDRIERGRSRTVGT